MNGVLDAACKRYNNTKDRRALAERNEMAGIVHDAVRGSLLLLIGVPGTDSLSSVH